MIAVGAQKIKSVFEGPMGVVKALSDGSTVHERGDGTYSYIYLYLDNSLGTENKAVSTS